MSEKEDFFVQVGEISREGRMIRRVVRALMHTLFSYSQFPWLLRAGMGVLGAVGRTPKNTIIRKETILGLPCEWIAPSQAAMDSAKTVLFLHGGGFVVGGADSHREFAAHIAHGAGVRVLLPEYRLAPENAFPAANDDCVGIYRWLLRRGVSASDILLAGDSAGGCLSLMTLQALRDAGDALPAAAVLISPVTDCLDYDGESYESRNGPDPFFTPTSLRTLCDHYAATRHPARAVLAPLKQPLKGLPPLFIQAGDAEVLRSDSVRLAERAAEAGVEVRLEVWEHMWHDFQMFAAMMPEARDAMSRIGAFAREHLALPAA